jgi:hypothetical protein
MSLTQEEFLEWKSNPVTSKFFIYLNDTRKEILEAWAEGTFTSESSDGTIQLNAAALGKVRLLADLQEIDHTWF